MKHLHTHFLSAVEKREILLRPLLQRVARLVNETIGARIVNNWKGTLGQTKAHRSKDTPGTFDCNADISARHATSNLEPTVRM
jgi:hypothetical protein